MSNTKIDVPTVQYICFEKKIIVENYISGISLNEYLVRLNTKNLYDIGKLMENFHNVNISSSNNEKSWILTILSDSNKIRESLLSYENDFKESIDFVEKNCKEIFSDLHFTYVHGDFRPANILYNQINEKYYLLDFENFMVGDSMLDIYKMLSVLKNIDYYNYNHVKAFLDGYSSIRKLPDKLIKKFEFYDIYYSLRSVRRAINDKTFRNSDDQYIYNADISAQRKNPKTIVMINWLKKYIKY